MLFGIFMPLFIWWLMVMESFISAVAAGEIFDFKNLNPPFHLLLQFYYNI